MTHPTHFKIKPALGADGQPLKLRDPQSGEYLTEAGQLMPRSGFWLRRFKEGDVVEVAEKPAKAPKEQSK